MQERESVVMRTVTRSGRSIPRVRSVAASGQRVRHEHAGRPDQREHASRREDRTARDPASDWNILTDQATYAALHEIALGEVDCSH